MAKRQKKVPKQLSKATTESEIPPGATRKALDRPLEPGGGPAGSGAGPRHAAGDTGSDIETFGPTEMTRTPASPPAEAEDRLEKGPPYAGRSGGAVGGTPAQLRSAEGGPGNRTDRPESTTTGPVERARIPPQSKPDGSIRLTGFAAIEYAEKQGLTLNKHPDTITGPRLGLSVAEAMAIAADDPNLIWLEVEAEDYYSGPPSSYEPER